MFSLFENRPVFRHTSGIASRTFRIVLGLVFVYLGVNMAGNITRVNSNINQPIKDIVYKYNSVSIVTTIVGDTANAISDSFEQHGTPTNPQEINSRAQNIAEQLSNKFTNRMPEVNSAVDHVLSSLISPFQKAIKDISKKTLK